MNRSCPCTPDIKKMGRQLTVFLQTRRLQVPDVSSEGAATYEYEINVHSDYVQIVEPSEYGGV